MFTLPEVHGKYPVGATTFAIPIQAQDDASRVVGRARLKPSSGGQPDTPALKLEEVAFTAYYPADVRAVKHAYKGVHWVPRCVARLAHAIGRLMWMSQDLSMKLSEGMHTSEACILG